MFSGTGSDFGDARSIRMMLLVTGNDFGDADNDADDDGDRGGQISISLGSSSPWAEL